MKTRDFLIISDDDILEIVIPDDLKIPTKFRLDSTEKMRSEIWYFWKMEA